MTTKMRVSLGLLAKVFKLPSDVQIVGVEKVDGPLRQVVFVLTGDDLPDAEFVEGTFELVVDDAVKFVGFETVE